MSFPRCGDSRKRNKGRETDDDEEQQDNEEDADGDGGTEGGVATADPREYEREMCEVSSIQPVSY